MASCGGNDTSDQAADDVTTTVDAATVDGLRTVSADEAAAVIDDAPNDLVVLDVRTDEEYADGHIDGAIVVDFYSPDFADQLAALDPDVPYVLYCQSGNRSGQTMTLLDELGFASVANVDGGILAWDAAGLPITTD